MINTKTNDFITDLSKLVWECGLPVCVARMALDLMRGQLVQLEAKALAQEAEVAKEQVAEAAES